MSDGSEARRRFLRIATDLDAAAKDAKSGMLQDKRKQEALERVNERSEKFEKLFGESFETVRENVNNSTKEYFVVYSGAERKVEQVDQFGNLKILVGKDKMNISFRGAESGRVEEK